MLFYFESQDTAIMSEKASFLHLPYHAFTTSDLIQWSKQTGMSLCDSLTFIPLPLSSEVIYAIQNVSPPNHACIFLMFGLYGLN